MDKVLCFSPLSRSPVISSHPYHYDLNLFDDLKKGQKLLPFNNYASINHGDYFIPFHFSTFH